LRPEKSEQVVTLSRGQKVKVVGHITSTSSVAGVTLGDCELTELTPSTLITISATDLTAAFKDNKGDAEKKYKGKDLVVEGKVVDKAAETNVWTVKLVGAAGVFVLCRMSKANFERVDKGDNVRVRGEVEFFQGDLLVLGGLGDCYVLKAK